MSKRYFRNFIFVAVILLSFILTDGCGSDKELISDWTNQQIKVDGETSDWQSNLEYLSDKNVALGFKNDEKYLYICLTTNDFTKVLPMFRSGFIIWFEPENGGKTIGIKYPIHNIINGNDRATNLNERIYDRENPGAFIDKMLMRQTELQVLNDDKYPLTDVPIENEEGIKAKLGYHSDRFIYELRMPLKDSKYTYKISAVPGEKLKVKFETEEIDKKNFRGERGGEMRMPGEEGGGRPGGFGDEGRHGRMRPGMNNGERTFEPLNFSIELTLQKNNPEVSGINKLN